MNTQMEKPGVVTVVSGLPRSGTSMMMQALEAGGMAVVTDRLRGADEDNLKGYHELEAVKSTRTDPSWLADAVGKAVKVIYMLLTDLPADYHYRVLFMRRDLDEVVRSQQTMLGRLGQAGADLPPQAMAAVFQRQLAKVDDWLAQQANLDVLDVPYHQMIHDGQSQARSVCRFLGLDLDVAAMAAAVDPALYRQRSG